LNETVSFDAFSDSVNDFEAKLIHHFNQLANEAPGRHSILNNVQGGHWQEKFPRVLRPEVLPDSSRESGRFPWELDQGILFSGG
jgi:hypothetical protein